MQVSKVRHCGVLLNETIVLAETVTEAVVLCCHLDDRANLKERHLAKHCAGQSALKTSLTVGVPCYFTHNVRDESKMPAFGIVTSSFSPRKNSPEISPEILPQMGFAMSR